MQTTVQKAKLRKYRTQSKIQNEKSHNKLSCKTKIWNTSNERKTIGTLVLPWVFYFIVYFTNHVVPLINATHIFYNYRYCGDDFKRSVMTDMNFLGITFTSGNNNQLLTGFNATISLIRGLYHNVGLYILVSISYYSLNLVSMLIYIWQLDDKKKSDNKHTKMQKGI